MRTRRDGGTGLSQRIVIYLTLSLCSGCATFTTKSTTTVHFQEEACKFIPTRVRIVEATPLFATKTTPSQFAKVLMDVGMRRYPTVFADTSNAVPVEVAIGEKASSSARLFLSVSLPTLFVVGGVIPFPIWKTSDFNVSVRLPSVRGTQPAIVTKTLTTEEATWASCFTPLGWIPIPGRSDGARTWDIALVVGPLTGFSAGYNAAKPTPAYIQLIQESWLDAIVSALKEIDWKDVSGVPKERHSSN